MVGGRAKEHIRSCPGAEASMAYTTAFPRSCQHELRRHPRHLALAAAALRGAGVRAVVEVVELSVAGARVRSQHPFRNGDGVELKLPLISSIPCSVVWASGSEVGLEFGRCIASSELTGLLHPDLE